MLHQYFQETMDFFGIRGSDLAEKAGCSRNNISELRKGKVSTPIDRFWQLVESCEDLAPGFKEKLAQKIAGYYFKTSSNISNSNFENKNSFIFQFNGTAEDISSQLKEMPPEAFQEILKAILMKMSEDVSAQCYAKNVL